MTIERKIIKIGESYGVTLPVEMFAEPLGIKDHAFINGNKRTAFQSLAVFLRYNGDDFSMNTDKKDEFTVNVVLHYCTFSEISNMMKEHSIKL